MPILTITYAGQTFHNAEVAAFGYEANAHGDIYVTASTETVEPQTDGPDATLDPELDPDGRYTAEELAIIRKRNATA